MTAADRAATDPNTGAAAAKVTVWPPECFYWAELDACGWSGRGPLPPGLLAPLAEQLPVELADVHPVAARLDTDRVLICAVPRAALAELDASMLELKPAALPPGTGAGASVNDLNLLVGEFEPAPVRAVRRARHAHFALTLLFCAALLAAGLVRRGVCASAAGAAAARASDEILRSAPEHRDDALARNARAMQAIADAARRVRPPTDASPALAELLKSWPTSVPSKPQSISITPDGISLSVVLDGDAAPLLAAFKPPPGYVIDEPRLSSAGTVTRLSLHLRPSPGGAK
ncbi:MAG TPA: hypothetical protein PKE29_02710 [Phycisphaerales bacterium]|nr:hypothetical protein [Phycisphaerales bacterium]